MHGHDDRFWMRRALQEAEKAFRQGEVPVGAVLVRDGEVVGTGRNQVESTGDPFAHAEMVAMRDAVGKFGRWALPECTMYVSLEPCVMCIGAIILARIPRLVFGAREDKTGACESVVSIPNERAFAHGLVVTGGLEAERSSEFLQQFFRKRRAGKD
jgi:tRNA(adenine34) deaminase